MQDKIKVESEYIKNKEMNNSITNESYTNSVIKEEEIDVYMNINENNIDKDRKLSILLNAFETSYSKKFYKELILKKKNIYYFQILCCHLRLKI